MKISSLVQQIKKKQSFLCVGLDSDISKIPDSLGSEADPVFAFNKRIIDAVAQYAVAIKPNTAFYETRGASGWDCLKKTAEYIKSHYPDIYLIADAKRGDIGNTSNMYARAFFEDMPFDAVTVAPYMGRDSVMPFLEFADKQVILLALTSNTGADDFQYVKNYEGRRLFEQVLETSKKWADETGLMYVAGATRADDMEAFRRIVPKHFLLVPGVGAQGGDLKSVIRHGMNDSGGLLINSSRAIIYADKGQNFDAAAADEAKRNQQAMKTAAAGFFSRNS